MARAWSTRSAIHRTLRLHTDPQRGEDVERLQAALNDRAKARGLPRVTVDGIYGRETQAGVQTVCYALGGDIRAIRKDEASPWLQRLARYPALRTPAELARARKRKAHISPPLATILTDTWGYHPGVHDGEDLICPPNEPLLAICDSDVVRADAGGWWGKGAPSDPDLKAKGDGIIILRSRINSGPIRKGMNLCYGHGEHATVSAGDRVRAGQIIGRAGFANAWHTHFMVNERSDTKGVGDRDPRPIIDYARGKR